MPTPTTRSPLALDGTVQGMTWAQFLNELTPYTLGAQQGSGGGAQGAYGYLPGLGGAAGGRSGGTITQDSYGGEGTNPTFGAYSYDSATPSYDSFSSGDLGDGTQNSYYQGPNGEILSKNATINNDSWWDSTGLPLVASLAFGGATAAAGLAGIGVDAAGNAIGAGAAALGGAGDGYTLGVPEGGIDVAGAQPNFSLENFSGAGGATTNDAAGLAALDSASVAEQGAAPGLFDAGAASPNLLQQSINAYSGLDPLTKAGISATSSLASSALSGGDGSAAVPGLSTSVGGGPSGTGISYSDAANSAANNTPYSGSANDGAPSSDSTTSNVLKGAGGLAGTVGKLINGDSLGASDYGSLLGAGGSLLSGILGYKSSNTAANQQIAAANNSNALAAAIYGNNTALNKPFVDAGTGALGQQTSLLGLNGSDAQSKAYAGFQTSPNYQFALSQGLRSVQGAASAAGGLYSGRAAKDLDAYAQGQASQQYNTYYNNLGGVAQLGQASANQQAANGNAYAASTTANNNAIGNAQSAGTVAGTNAITGSIGSLLGQNASGTISNSLLGQNNSSGISNALLAQLLKNSSGNNGYYPQT